MMGERKATNMPQNNEYGLLQGNTNKKHIHGIIVLKSFLNMFYNQKQGNGYHIVLPTDTHW